jgi:hypothetical protein
MRLHVVLRQVVAVAVLVGCAAAAPAADLEKYLPNDAECVVVVNVKQILAWPPFKKRFQNHVEQLLKRDPVQKDLRELGFDPLHDLDRVVVVGSASSVPQWMKSTIFPDIPPNFGRQQELASFTFGFAQGKFDVAKIKAKMDQALKDQDGESHKDGESQVWQFPTKEGRRLQHYDCVAMLGDDTVLACIFEDQAADALKKAGGDKKTDLKEKRLRQGLAKSDPKAILEVTSPGGLVMHKDKDDRDHTLRDDGIEGFHAVVTPGDADLSFQLSVAFKNADEAKRQAADWGRLLDVGPQLLKKAIADHPDSTNDLALLLETLKSVKLRSSDDTVFLEGNATGEAVEAGFWQLNEMFLGLPLSQDRSPPVPQKDK